MFGYGERDTLQLFVYAFMMWSCGLIVLLQFVLESLVFVTINAWKLFRE